MTQEHAESNDALRGVRIGKYKLVRKLAVGGMAELFLARATAMHGFEKLVVLKRILPQYAESEDFVRMFLTEAKLAAALHHPNIAQVYDIGEHGGVFFTMEYVRGRDLRQLLRACHRQRHPLHLEHALHICSSVASGLHYAHTEIGLDGAPLRIVHRDVSPSNVLIAFDGTVKVVDFGIAKASTVESVTRSGTLKGKLPYMSPEQCQGDNIDHRSDQFSLGILLWELTTGRRLFASKSDFSTLQRVASADVPPPTSFIPSYPPELEAIVMQALALDPDDRFSNVGAFQLALETFAHQAHLLLSSSQLRALMTDLFAPDAREIEEDFVNPATRIQTSPPASATHTTDPEHDRDIPSSSQIVSPGHTTAKQRAERFIVIVGLVLLAVVMTIYIASQWTTS